MILKLFKNNNWIKYLFEIELILIVSFALSMLITMLVGMPKTDDYYKTEDNSGIFEKYKIFTSINNINVKNITEDINNTENNKSFIKDFITLRSLSSELENKSYGIIDDFINKFNSDDKYLLYEKNKLKLRNLFIKQKYSEYIDEYNGEKYGFTYDMMLLKSFIFLKNETKSNEIFGSLLLSHPIKFFTNYLSETELSGFLKKISQSFWNKKLENMLQKGNFSDFRNISKYIKDKQLIYFVSAEIAYSKKQYSRTKLLLKKIKSTRFQTGKEKLLLKMRIREQDYANIDQALEKIISDKVTYKRLIYDIASLFLMKGESEKSLEYFSKFISLTKADKSNYNEDYWKALWTSVWLKIKVKDYKGVKSLFYEGSKSSVRSYRLANSFWYSFISEKNYSEIKKHPFTYYYARLTQYSDVKNHFKKNTFKNLFNKKGSELFYRLVFHIKEFLRYGLSDESLEYISWIKNNENLSTEDMNSIKFIETLIYFKRGDHYFTFTSFKNNFDNYQEIILPYFLREIYLPLRYEKLIAKYISGSGIKKELILAIINRESMFRPNIVSPAKAKGLMQLIDRTAKQTARKLGFKLKKNQIYNPEINIRLGTAHLKELLNKYDGKIYLALAAYNAGSHRVKKWIENFGNFEEEKFIEMIPFSETRNYVKNILRNYYYYMFYSAKNRSNVKL